MLFKLGAFVPSSTYHTPSSATCATRLCYKKLALRNFQSFLGADSCYFWGASRNFHGRISCEHVFSMMGRFIRDGMMDFGSETDPNKHGFQKFFAWLRICAAIGLV